MLFEYLLNVLVFVVVQIHVQFHNQMLIHDVWIKKNFVLDQLIMNDNYLYELLIIDLYLEDLQ